MAMGRSVDFTSVKQTQPVDHIPARQALNRVVQNDPTPPGTNKAYRGQWNIPVSKQPRPQG